MFRPFNWEEEEAVVAADEGEAEEGFEEEDVDVGDIGVEDEAVDIIRINS